MKELIFIGYSHDDRPMFWAKTTHGLVICYGQPVLASIGLQLGDKVSL